MKYHFIVNLNHPDAVKQMQEQKGFAERYLAGFQEGEAILLALGKEQLERCGQRHVRDAAAVIGADDSPETLLRALVPLVCREDLYLFSGEPGNMQLAARLGYRLDGSSANAVHAISVNGDGELFVKRMMYANHMEAVCAPGGAPFFFSLANGMDKAELEPGAFRIKKEFYAASAAEHIISEEWYPEESGKGLENCSIIVAGGRGVGGRDGMATLRKLAETMGGRLGASRPAVMNAWAPMDELVGVSGSMVQPEICIAAGISGAAAFFAGIEKSRWITAVNRDVKAPIMKMADVAVEADYASFIEELERLIKSEN